MLRNEHVEKTVKANRILQEKKHKHDKDDSFKKHPAKGSHKAKRHVNWTKAYQEGDLDEYEDWEA